MMNLAHHTGRRHVSWTDGLLADLAAPVCEGERDQRRLSTFAVDALVRGVTRRGWQPTGDRAEVLGDSSMKSEWVATEIYKARQRERREGKQVLFPIRLVPFEQVRDWSSFDADSGKDMAREG